MESRVVHVLRLEEGVAPEEAVPGEVDDGDVRVRSAARPALALDAARGDPGIDQLARAIRGSEENIFETPLRNDF